jgi:hypothetical protein
MRFSNSIALAKRSLLMGLLAPRPTHRVEMFRQSYRKFREHCDWRKLPAPGVHLPGVYRRCGTLSWEIQIAFDQGAVARLARESTIMREQGRKAESTLRNPARLDIKPRSPS